MGGKSKKTTQTTNQTTSTTPYAGAQPGLDQLLLGASQAYANTPKTPVYTGPNADQLGAIESVRSTIPKLSQGADEYSAMAAATARGDYLNPASNPFLQGAIDAAINPLKDTLDSRIVGVGDAATMAGAYGGDRQALLKAKALKNFDQSALDATSRITYDNYQAERNRQVQAAAQIEAANQLQLAQAKALASIGDQQSAWDLAAKSAAIDAPWAGADRLAQILQSVQGYSTTNTQGTGTTTGPSTGGASGALGGAVGGASAGAAFGPWGAGIGAVLGGLGGLFG